MGISSLLATSGNSRGSIYGTYKDFIASATQSNQDLTLSGSTSSLGLLIAKTITINSATTFTFNTGTGFTVIATEKLTLNGTIQVPTVTGISGTYGGVSGTGRGNIFIFAKQIVGTGTINAKGGNATAPTSSPAASAYDGKNGTLAKWLDTAATIIPGGPFSNNGNNYQGGSKAITNTSDNLYFYLAKFFENYNYTYEAKSGSGATGSATFTGGTYLAGGGGGASLVADGGSGKYYGTGGIDSAGHGGGGAGSVFIFTEQELPAITVDVSGGDGSLSFYGSSTIRGGGGAGGLVVSFAPLAGALATITNGGSGGGGVNNGGTGVSIFQYMNLK